jgi:L-ascorbate metabolism protein UlaG (beta-lactamase superfamily)
MTAEEAVVAAGVLKPKVVIPMHYGAIVGSADDAKRFQEALRGTCDVVVLG